LIKNLIILSLLRFGVLFNILEVIAHVLLYFDMEKRVMRSFLLSTAGILGVEIILIPVIMIILLISRVEKQLWFWWTIAVILTILQIPLNNLH